MPSLAVIPNADGAWPDLADREIHHVTEEEGSIAVAGLAGGMESGAPSVAIRIDCPDGETVVVAETSLRLFLTAADALKARYGDPRIEVPRGGLNGEG